jgi:hypothetical protein
VATTAFAAPSITESWLCPSALVWLT